MKRTLYALMLTLLLPACASKPLQGPPEQVKCPAPPPIVKVPLGEDFLTEAERILFGSPSGQTKSGPR